MNNDETGWLIEHSGNVLDVVQGQASWLRVEMKLFGDGDGALHLGFTIDASKALRFSRREDGEAVLAMYLGVAPSEWYRKPFSVTEHKWPAPSKTPNG